MGSPPASKNDQARGARHNDAFISGKRGVELLELTVAARRTLYENKQPAHYEHYTNGTILYVDDRESTIGATVNAGVGVNVSAGILCISRWACRLYCGNSLDRHGVLG